MKLSRAIRKGAKDTPQSFGRHFGEKGACSALGALALALNLSRTTLVIDPNLSARLCDEWPELRQPCKPPGFEPADSTLFNAIDFLNDAPEWPREKIADWLEALGY